MACQARRRLITGRFFVFFFIQGDGPINEGGGGGGGGAGGEGGVGWCGRRSYSRKFMVCFLRVLNVRNYVGCCHGNDNDMEILF